VGNTSVDASAKGFEFLSLHLGGDFHVTPEFVLGPTVSMAFGQYGSYSVTQTGNAGGNATTSADGDFRNTSLHEWFTIGIRGHYDL
jgi:hypothetical protein